MLKLTSLKTLALVSVTALATTLLIQACGGGGAVAQSASDADVIEGVWDATVTNKDCTSGAVLGQPFKALIVFRRAGTVDVDNAQGRTLRGNIYGTWKHGADTVTDRIAGETGERGDPIRNVGPADRMQCQEVV